MSIHYSDAKKGFYCDAIHGESIPGDAIKISSKKYNELLVGISSGKIIVVSGSSISLVEPPPSSEHQIAEIARRLAAIDAESIRPLRAIASGNGTPEDASKLEILEGEVMELRNLLETINQQ